jgi:hypothetical protein
MKAWVETLTGGHWSKRIYPVAFFFRAGLTWPARTWRLRVFGLVPADSIFSHTGTMIFPALQANEAGICGLLNSELLNALKIACNPERKWEVGLVSSFPVAGAVPGSSLSTVSNLVRRIASATRARHESDETCLDFKGPDLRRAWEAVAGGSDNLGDLLILTIEKRHEAEREIEVRMGELDVEVYSLYGISEDDRSLIKREMGRRSDLSVAVAPQDEIGEGADAEENEGLGEEPIAAELSLGHTRDLVARWISFYLKQVLESDDDGIIPVWPTRTEAGLIVRLRDTIEKDLGKEAAVALIGQAPRYLGTDDVTQWLSTSHEETVEIDGKNLKLSIGFFPWHVDLYRKRPIFWLLSSEGFEHGKTRFRLQIYLHYLKLTPDTLPRLVSHYLEPVIEDYVHKEWADAQARAGRLEGKSLAAAKAEAQEWLNTLDALKGFRAAIEAVIQGPSQAERVSTNAKWLTRTIAAVRGGQDLGHGYKPDVDYGVRVNIAPLIEKRLLPKLVLKKLGG